MAKFEKYGKQRIEPDFFVKRNAGVRGLQELLSILDLFIWDLVSE